MTNKKFLDFFLPLAFGASVLNVEICLARTTDVDHQKAPAQIELSAPKSEFAFEEVKIDEIRKHEGFIEFSVANWNINSLHEDSFLANTSDYKSTATPKLSVMVGKKYLQNNWGIWNIIAGFSFSQAERNGNYNIGLVPMSASEDLKMYGVQFGLEWLSNQSLGKSNLKPLVSVYLNPIYSQAENSAFSDGISQWTTTVETNLGLEWQPDGFKNSKDHSNNKVQWSHLFFTAGYENTQPIAQLAKGPNISGDGFWIGSRIDWQ